MIVTLARPNDMPVLTDIMYKSVHEGALHYTVPQRHAWLPKQPDTARFARKHRSNRIWVARSYRGPVAMMSVDRRGYIDVAFILAQFTGKGVFRLLFDALRSRQEGRLTVHASLHAQPAFRAMGFETVHHEVVKRRGQALPRAFMQRD